MYSSGNSGSTIGGPLAGRPKPHRRPTSAQDVWAEGSPNLTIEGNLDRNGRFGSGTHRQASPAASSVSPVRVDGVRPAATSSPARGLLGHHDRERFDTEVRDGRQGQLRRHGRDRNDRPRQRPATGSVILTRQVAVGGIGPGEGNVIAFNGGAGVLRRSTPARRVRPEPDPRKLDLLQPREPQLLCQLGHRSRHFRRLRREASRPTISGTRTRGERLQNFPIITSAVPSGGSTTIQGGSTAWRARPSRSTSTRTPRASAARRGSARADLSRHGQRHDRRRRQRDHQRRPPGRDRRPADPSRPRPPTRAGNTSEFSQRIVVSSDPGPGSRPGRAYHPRRVQLPPGATVSVGGAPGHRASSSPTTTRSPRPPRPVRPGSLNDVTVTNTDGTAGTLPNGWVADFLDVPGGHAVLRLRHEARRQRDHRRRRRRQLRRGSGRRAPADGRLPAGAKYGLCYMPPPCTRQVFPDVPCSSLRALDRGSSSAEGITGGCGGGNYCPVSPVTRAADGRLPPAALGSGLRPACLHGADLRRRALLVDTSPPGSSSSSPRASPPAAAAATTARARPPTAARWPCSWSRRSICHRRRRFLDGRPVLALVFGVRGSGFAAARLRRDLHGHQHRTTPGPARCARRSLDANAHAGPDTIAFNVSGRAATAGRLHDRAGTPLPSIPTPSPIDGYTQPGASPNTNAAGRHRAVLKIVLSGANLAGLGRHPHRRADDVDGPGPRRQWRLRYASAPSCRTTTSSRGCFIGIDAAGAGRRSERQRRPRAVRRRAPRSAARPPADRNLISGNTATASTVERRPIASMQGNLIGTDVIRAARAREQRSAACVVGIDCPGTVDPRQRRRGRRTRRHRRSEIGLRRRSTASRSRATGSAPTSPARPPRQRRQRDLRSDSHQVTVGGIGAGRGQRHRLQRAGGVLVVYDSAAADHESRSAATRSTDQRRGSPPASTSEIRRSQAASRPTTSATRTPGPTTTRTFRSSRRPCPRGGGSTTILGRLNSAAEHDVHARLLRQPGLRAAGPRNSSRARPTSARPRSRPTAPATRRSTSSCRSRSGRPHGHRDGDRPRRQHLRVLAAHRRSRRPRAPGSRRGRHVDHAHGLRLPAGRHRDGRRRAGHRTSSSPTTTRSRPRRRALPPGTLNDITVTNPDGTRRHAAQRLGRRLPRRAGQPAVLRLRHDAGPQRDHRRRRRRQLRRRPAHAAPADGGLPAEGQARPLLRAAALHRASSPTCPAPRPSRPGSRRSPPRASPAAAAAATTARTSPSPAHQMAVFLLKTMYGSAYVPPACTRRSSPTCPVRRPFAPWIERARRPRHHRRLRRRQLLPAHERQPRARWPCSWSRRSACSENGRHSCHGEPCVIARSGASPFCRARLSRPRSP